MFTVIIVMFLMILFYVLGMVKNKMVRKRHRLTGAVRVLVFSGGGIGAILFGLVVGYLAAWCLGTISPGKYKKMTTDKIVPIDIGDNKYDYIKKIQCDGKDTIITFKFCCLNSNGDLNFGEYMGNDSSYVSKNVELHICEVEPCDFRVDYYRMVSIEGIMKYFALSHMVLIKTKIYVPKNVKVKEIYM